jgi:hypothetical protein
LAWLERGIVKRLDELGLRRSERRWLDGGLDRNNSLLESFLVIPARRRVGGCRDLYLGSLAGLGS